MRGRLINPFKAKVARIDLSAQAADPDGAGPLVSGYDNTFREPIPGIHAPGDRLVDEATAILIPCQFEPEDQFDILNQQAAGDDTNSRVRVVYHFADLEELGLVHPDTLDPFLRIGDRLISIHRFDDETLLQRCGFAAGLFCTEVKPESFGLTGGERNLLVCTYNTRDSSVKAAG